MINLRPFRNREPHEGAIFGVGVMLFTGFVMGLTWLAGKGLQTLSTMRDQFQHLPRPPQRNFDSLLCNPASNPLFQSSALSTFQHLYLNDTGCSSPYETFIRLRESEPGLLKSFRTYTETRTSFDKESGRQISRKFIHNQPGENPPSLITIPFILKDPNGKEFSYDPGYGDQTNIHGELKGRGNNHCVLTLKRKCK